MDEGEGAEFFKRLRKGAKISITKKIKKINSLYRQPNSKASVLKILEGVKSKFSDAKEYNDKLIKIEPDDKQITAWLEDINEEIEACKTRIFEFFDSVEYEEIKENNSTKLWVDKVENMKQRIVCISKSISEKTLQKLQDSFRELKIPSAYDKSFLDESQVDNLELSVDNCIADAAGYIEACSMETEKINRANYKNHQSIHSQLKRVEIPKFNGEKEKYFNWKLAFMSCVHTSPISDEIKLLHLKQYLEGSAIKILKV